MKNGVVYWVERLRLINNTVKYPCTIWCSRWVKNAFEGIFKIWGYYLSFLHFKNRMIVEKHPTIEHKSVRFWIFRYRPFFAIDGTTFNWSFSFTSPLNTWFTARMFSCVLAYAGSKEVIPVALLNRIISFVEFFEFKLQEINSILMCITMKNLFIVKLVLCLDLKLNLR